MKKDLVVVTNFGCDKDCIFCKSKLHPFIGKDRISSISTINWDKLSEYIKNLKSYEKIIVSGGGDPMYKCYNQDTMIFYKKLCRMSSGHMIEVHTRILPMNMEILHSIYRIVYYVDIENPDSLDELARVFSWYSANVDIRVATYITRDTKDSDIIKLVDKCKRIGIHKITIKQYFGCTDDDTKNYNELEKACNNVGELFWVNDDDRHNYFYLYDNSYHTTYIGYTENDTNRWRQDYKQVNEDFYNNE